MSSDSDSIALPASLVALGVIAIYVVGWLWVADSFGQAKSAGEFGDQFGAVNTLFSGLAFAGIVLAIFLQKNELKLQREELADTRAVLSEQKLQLEQQAKTLGKQLHESTLFHLLRLHAESVARMDASKFTGTDCFPYIVQHLSGRYQHHHQGESDQAKALGLAYADTYQWARQDLGRYFRSLKEILLFVDSSDVEPKDIYARAVRAQLTDYEMILLLYQVRLNSASGSLEQLVDTYEILRGIEPGLLLAESHRGLLKC